MTSRVEVCWGLPFFCTLLAVWVDLDFVLVAERCSGGCYLPEEEEESERQRKEEDKKDSLPFGSFFHTNDPFFAILD